MPQLFQVLKCFKCSVFQVHQTKKSNKWGCKLCGEKQSIKRHYGLGTGKECRLHVQKLNSIRGEVDEITKLNESSDEELLEDALFLAKKHTNLTSKWSEYVDKTEDVIVPEPEYFENAEVVLEIPAKRRRTIHKSKDTMNPPIKLISTTFSKTDSFDKVHNLQTQISDVHESLLAIDVATIKNTNDVELSEMKKQTDCLVPKPEIKAFVPHRVDKSSKWAQFTGDEENYNCEDLSFKDDVNAPITDDDILVLSNANVEISHDTRDKSTYKNLATNIFSLCDEKDFDDVLDF